jgi:YspA, cpYpsA-related SLOG family
MWVGSRIWRTAIGQTGNLENRGTRQWSCYNLAMRVLAFGGRYYADRATVYQALDALHRKHGIACLIDGDCPYGGADQLSHEWAVDRGVPTERYAIDHMIDGPWPNAGPKRNGRMLAASRPDAAVGFPGDRGTRDMARQLWEAGIEKVWRVGW